jgi:UPF0271 protein
MDPMTSHPVILNADLGEGEKPEKTARLIQLIGAANIACGGHAGSLESMQHCLQCCRDFGTLPGAHPGMPAEFGRGTTLPQPADFMALLTEQWSRLHRLAVEEGLSLHHIKLHGSLYLAVEHHPDLAETYLKFLSSLSPSPVVFCLAAGSFASQARAAGLNVWEEVFCDRHYEADKSLRSRKHPDSLLCDPDAIEARIRGWLESGNLFSISHEPLALAGQTLCLHSDSDHALETAERLHALLAKINS